MIRRRPNLFLYYLLQYTWGIIQNILGFLLYVVLSLRKKRRLRGLFNGARILSWDNNGSLALGRYIFISNYIVGNPIRVIVHEYGHTIQSCILGPFYIPIIGIPSLLWAKMPNFRRNRLRGRYTYSSFYPEKWANHLGRKYTKLPSIDGHM